MPHDSRGVANAVLRYAWDADLDLTKMQLIKLVYLVHGWSSVFFSRPLVEDRVQAWKRGPVYPRLYRALSGYTSQPVNRLLIDNATSIPFSAVFENEGQERLVEDITTAYGKLHAFDLSEKTHERGTPWDQTYHNKGEYAEIDNHLIQQHFQDLREARGIDERHYDF